jgi:hypothetical protein
MLYKRNQCGYLVGKSMGSGLIKRFDVSERLTFQTLHYHITIVSGGLGHAIDDFQA